MSAVSPTLHLKEFRKEPITIQIDPKYRVPPIPEDALMLLKNQQLNGEFYCVNSDPLDQKRLTLYKKQNENEYEKVKRGLIIRVLKEDIVKNAKIMTISIGVCAGIGSIGAVGGPLMAAAGVCTGIGVGTIIGGAIITHLVNEKVNIQIKYSDQFTLWRMMAIRDKVYPLFQRFIKENQFDEFFCPISLQLCNMPMLAPDGKTYDKENIEEYISYKTNQDDVKVPSPFRNGSFCKKDLILDTNYMKKLIKKCEQIYQQILKKGDENVEKYGLEAVMENSKEIMNKTMIEIEILFAKDLEPRVKADIMSPEARDAYIAKVKRPYDYTINDVPEEEKETCTIF